ncbi:MAG TPA: hypothetical protein IAC11_06270 [Candidatus Limiplasma pullicola]|nr:hypothetical protein [Candidatus Limiplasma pullicola]
MTLDELVVRVRVAVEEADGELDAVLSDLRRFAGEAAAAAGDAAAPQEALWAELAEAAKGAFSQVAEAVRAGLSLAAAVPAGEEGQALREAWGALLGPEGALAGDLTSLGEAAGTALPAVGEGLTALLETFQAAAEGAEGLSEALPGPAEALSPLAQAQAGATAGAAEYADAASDMAQALRGLESQARSLSGIQRHIDAYRDAKRAYDDARKSGRNVEKEFDSLSGAARKLGVNVDKGSGSLEAMDEAAAAADRQVDALGDGVQREGAGIVSTLQGMLSQARQTEQALMIQAAMGVDVSQPLSAIQAVIALITTLLSLMGQAGISAGGGGGSRGGGGGGGSRRGDDEADAAEAARRAAEEAERRRQEAIEADYRLIEHRRHMNEITFEEELAQLEALRQKHQLNAEEIMDWEEKVYDLKQEIRERDAESLDQLSDSVIDALENRYQAMLDGETARLEQSREAWQTWRDDSVRAVEDQIAALDQLAKAQDREKQDAEELRKIEKLRQQIAYEQDDFNRAKLQQQLDQALESREERLARLDLEDQKEALRAQIEQIEQAADSQLEALDREQEAVEAAYAERMQEAALRAEAEKLILSQSQDELLSLLEQYAPEYDALGQTLGERLLDGFARGVGDVAAWFEDFSARLTQAQADMAALAQSAADAFYDSRQTPQAAPAVTVNQTVEFNQPVETPAQVARRMEEVNEALAVML